MTDELLKRIDALAPRFGRAAPDLVAIVSRAGDHRGVLQNARLVVETLLRDVYARELGQAPGKKMLGDLTAQFRQQGNVGIVPTEVLFFIDGVAAAGNLGAHDHAARLDDPGVQMSGAHALTSLNNLVAVLEWYAGKYLAGADSSTSLSTRAAGSRSSMLLAAAVVGVVLVAAGVAVDVAASRKEATIEPASTMTTTTPSRAALDRWYASVGDPPPPESCRATGPALEALAAAVATKAPVAASASAAEEERFVAASLAGDDRTVRAEAEAAAACVGFAAAENLAGKIALKEDRLDDALRWFQAAEAHAADFVKPRFNRALVLLKRGNPDALALLESLAVAPDARAEVFLVLGHARTAAGSAEQAQLSYCRARDLGSAAEAEIGADSASDHDIGCESWLVEGCCELRHRISDRYIVDGTRGLLDQRRL